MIKVRFFARLREELGVERLDMAWSQGMTVAELLSDLQQQSAVWADTLSKPNLLVAVEQQHADPTTVLQDNVEVAFFPPVTGG